MLELIRTARPLSDDNEEMLSVIREEAEKFFAGDVTAEEAAGMIQNRIRLYLSENS